MTEADRETLRRYIADRAPVWEVEFDAGPGMVVSLADAAHVAAQFVAEEREKAFNEGALAGMRLAAEHRKAAKDVQ